VPARREGGEARRLAHDEAGWLRKRQADPIGMTWDEDNIGQRIYDPVSGGAVDFDTATGNRKWDLFTLDPGNAYKRAFYGRLAGALAACATVSTTFASASTVCSSTSAA
jgi:hypothetical protein